MKEEKHKLNRLNAYLTEYVKEKGTYHISMDNIFDELNQENKVINFNSDWNYLMSLLEIIEENEPVEKMICDKNYFKLQAIKDDSSVQDKGSTKMEAIFHVCIQFLSTHWKMAPYNTRTSEPFDKEDLL
jgi:hypothetical protein